jgi:branched-chain amino acid transport system substrate-binding protein
MIRRLRAGGLATALALFLGASSAGAAAPPYEINVILSLTGTGAFLGNEEAQSIRAIERMVNAHGGIDGQPIAFTIKDDGSNPAVAVQLANGIIAAHAPVILGPSIVSTCSAVMPMVKSDGPLQYCYAPGIHPTAGSYTFSSMVGTKDLALAGIRYFRGSALKKIAVIVSTDATGQEGEDTVNQDLALPENSSMTVVAREHFNVTDLSVSAQMQRIKASGAQALIAWTVGTPFGTVLRGMTDAAVDIPVLTNSGNIVRAQMTQYAPFAPHTLLFTGVRSLAHDVARSGPVKTSQDAFFSAMDAAHINPDIGQNIAWDATLLVVDALRHLGTHATAKQLHDYLEALHGYAGINGIIDFRDGSQRGLTGSSAVIVQWSPARSDWIPVSQPGGLPLPSRR